MLHRLLPIRFTLSTGACTVILSRVFALHIYYLYKMPAGTCREVNWLTTIREDELLAKRTKLAADIYVQLDGR